MCASQEHVLDLDTTWASRKSQTLRFPNVVIVPYQFSALRNRRAREPQAVGNETSQATAGLSTPKKPPFRLIKSNPVASIEPVQPIDTAIPLPPKYRSRGLNTPRVQDVTDPAIRALLFGPLAQIDHHQHYGTGYDERPDLIQHDSASSAHHESTRFGNNDSVGSVQPSSTSSTKDDNESGKTESVSPRSHSSSECAGTDGSGFNGGASASYSDTSGSGGAGHTSDAVYDQVL